MNGRTVNQVICAYEPSATPCAAWLQKKDIPLCEEPVFQDDLTPSAGELGPPGDGTKQYLAVGYALRTINTEYQRHNNMRKKTSPARRFHKTPFNVIAWNDAEPPILVVADVAQSWSTGIPPERLETVQLWGLLRPRNGLCTPYPIKCTMVFYFWEFRGDTAGAIDRAALWTSNIREQYYKSVGRAPMASMFGVSHGLSIASTPSSFSASSIAAPSANFSLPVQVPSAIFVSPSTPQHPFWPSDNTIQAPSTKAP